jgi:hypothetical protein
VNAVMNLRVPQNAWNFLASWEPVSVSGRTLLCVVSYGALEDWNWQERPELRVWKPTLVTLFLTKYL